MIRRTYIVGLNPLLQGFPNLDIVVAVPGARTAPVLDPVTWAGQPFTPPPANWAAACGANWYYEQRGRALRLEAVAGAAGFVPRFNLGVHLSIVALQAADGSADDNNLLPTLTPSASLMPAPLAAANAALGAAYVNALADPSYGPIIRIWNDAALFEGREAQAMIYMVNLRISENKDEDFNTLGHA